MAKANIDYIPGYGTFGMAKDMLSPNVTPNPNGPGPAVPGRRATRLYNDLMSYYGSPDLIRSGYGMLNTLRDAGYYDPMQEGALKDTMSSIFGFIREPYFNEDAIRSANHTYDRSQPYSDFSMDSYPNLIDNMDGSHFYANPDGSVSYNGNVFTDEWEPESTLAQPGEEGFIGDAKNAIVPIAKTAGSMALPMLFNMLLRGGK